MQDSEDDRRIQAILASGVKIPPIPEMLMRLETLLRDEEAGPNELANLISHDGALSGAVFRVVGSPVFGLRAKVDNLGRAVALLGMKNAAAILRSEAMRAALGDPEHARALAYLWSRASAVAELSVLASKTARLRGIAPDSAFTLGMFHDCGLALLCKRFPAYARALDGAGTWPDIPALDQANRMSHAMMGQMVAKNWALPADIVLAIRHHHDLAGDDLPEPVGKLCALLNFACHVHNLRSCGDDREWESGWRDETLRRLDMDENGLVRWEDEMRSEMAQDA